MAGIPFLHNIKLNGNMLLDAKLHPSDSAPSNPGIGTIWYDTQNDLVKIYDNTATGNVGGWNTISGDITGVGSATTAQLTVANSSGPVPSFSIVTGAVANAGTALATGDQIHTFVTTQTDTMAADTSGNAATATKIASITNSNIVQLTSTQTLTNKTLVSPTISGDVTIQDSSPQITLLDTTNNTDALIYSDDSGSINISADENDEQGSSAIKFFIDGSEKMKLDATGLNLSATNTTLTAADQAWIKQGLLVGNGQGVRTSGSALVIDGGGDSSVNLRFILNSTGYATSDGGVIGFSNNGMLFLKSSETTGSNYGVNLQTSGGTSILFAKGSNQRVGIGTMSPSKTLDVNGDVNITGDLNITGDGSNATVLSEYSDGDFSINVVNDLELDAGGGDIILRKNGNNFGSLSDSSGQLAIKSNATTFLTGNHANATFAGNVTVSGNLTVNGTTTDIDTTNLVVEDPLIKLAKNNNGSDSLDIGFYGLYDTSGSQDLFAGLFRDAGDGKFKLFKDLQAEPTTTVNTSGTGYAVATLVANIEGNITGTADQVANALTVDNTTIQLNSGTTYNGGAARTISAKTAAIADGGTGLATADQIYDHVTSRLSTEHAAKNKSFELDDNASGVASSDNITYTITHGMGASRLYKVEVIEDSGNYETVYVEVQRPSDTTIKIIFASAVTAGAYRALITKI